MRFATIRKESEFATVKTSKYFFEKDKVTVVDDEPISATEIVVFTTREEAENYITGKVAVVDRAEEPRPKKVDVDKEMEEEVNPEFRKYADNILSQNTRTVLKQLQEDTLHSAEAEILLDIEKSGKNRKSVIKFLKNAVKGK